MGSGFSRQFRIVGQSAEMTSLQPTTMVQMVTPEYFETFGIRFTRGRALTAHDGHASARVAVVNERFVKRFLEGQDPVGRRVAMSQFIPGGSRQGFGPGAPGASAEWQIVGVYRDVSNLEQFGDPTAPQICLPFAQSPRVQAMVAVRTASDPEALRRSLTAEVRAADPDLPMTDVRTMEQVVDERLASDRLNMALYGGLAVLALVLAALGIYGVMSYTVAQRTPEIGLRMALGASRSDVELEVLREGLALAAGGLLLGLAGAYALGRAMQGILYGTGSLNLRVLLAVGLVLLTAALVACYLPARRASGADPMIALRQG
jgi:putative ABC transport system permease protein